MKLLLTFNLGRHGDIEDTLLTLLMSRAAGGKKFDKMNVARVYFGNWLRDYCSYPSKHAIIKLIPSQPKLLTLAPSNMSLRKLFEFSSGFSGL